MGLQLPALVTVVALLLYLGLAFNVGQARGRYGVKAPATTGDPAFERIYRVHQNTVEQLLLFLPGLWLFAVYASPLWGAVLGAIWIVGRLLFAAGYARDAERRYLGLALTVTPSIALLVGALIGIVVALLRA